MKDNLPKATVLTRIALAFALILSAFPIYWMFIIATRGNDVVGQVPPPLLPGGNLGENLERLWDMRDANFVLGLTNSAIIATTVTVSVVVLSTLAGFAFAKLRFKGRDGLLVTVLLTMAVPLQQMGIIPLYIMMVKLGWTDQLQAVILPFLVNAFGVFFMRQYAEQAIPDELIEAARVDGCSTLRIYWSIVLPALRPAIAVLGLLTFMQTWNEFIWPMAVLTQSNPTVQLSLSNLNGAHFQDYTLVFTGTALATLPLIVIFIAFGRQIVGGIMEGAVK
ncbi:carbohydrate ABC transporter permease [Actinocorallia aurea]